MPIKIEGIRTKLVSQIPTMSKVDKAIFEAPTKFLVTSLKPNRCLN